MLVQAQVSNETAATRTRASSPRRRRAIAGPSASSTRGTRAWCTEFCWRACRRATPKTSCRTSSCRPCGSFASCARRRRSGAGSPPSRAIAPSTISANRSSAPTSTSGPSASTASRANQEAFEILELIKTLPEAYRETLILRLVEGMTGPEIAARTGLTPESVRVNLCRGMKMLRELL